MIIDSDDYYWIQQFFCYVGTDSSRDENNGLEL